MSLNIKLPEISVVATVYNAEPVIEELVNEISKVCAEITSEYEIILVEDCGPDKSWDKIQNICKTKPYVKGIKLSRNFGQQMAMSAGIRFAKGELIIIMDGDLQNPPEAIPEIINKIKEGYDIVYTQSNTRNNFKDEFTSKLFWFIINKVFKVGMIPNQLMLKGFNRKFAETFNSYEERIRVVSGITHDIGLNQICLQVENKKRKFGKSNYSFFQRFYLMVDIVMAMTNAPLNFLVNISLLSLLTTFLMAIYNLYVYFFYQNVPEGYTSIVLLILFFGSLTTLILGIIGKYLSNIYAEVKKRPTFIVNKRVNF